MKNLVFFLGVGLIFTHELDAMLNNEWRVLPLTSWLSDEYGQIAFLTAHIPVFAISVALISSANLAVRNRSRFGISIFLVIHGVLHTIYLANESYEFESVISKFLIYGSALCGFAYLVLDQKHVAKST